MDRSEQQQNVTLKSGEVLQIRKWSEVFERSDARKLKTLTWISMPTGFESNGLQMLFDDFEPAEAVMLYGAWCLLLKIAARSAERGRLGGSQGKPYSVDSLSRQMQGVPCEIVEQLLSWCVFRSGWLEIVRVGEPAMSPPTPQLPRVGVPAMSPPTCVSENFRESPDYRTGPDRTQQDQSGRPVEPARPETFAEVKSLANDVAARIRESLRASSLTDRTRLAVWRTAVWLHEFGEPDRTRRLDEICAVVREQRPERPARMLFQLCRCRDPSPDSFASRWDATQIPVVD